MTDRYHSLTVVLENDIREDDAEAIMNAIRMIKKVISVSGNISNVQSHIAEERARFNLGSELWKVIYPERK
jgi:hypothetical protein